MVEYAESENRLYCSVFAPLAASRGAYVEPPLPAPRLMHTRMGKSTRPEHVTATEPVTVASEVVAGEIDPKLMLDMVAEHDCARAIAPHDKSSTNKASRR
jgi:hypothetical protein